MHRQFGRLLIICRGFVQHDLKCKLGGVPQYQFLNAPTCFPSKLVRFRAFHLEEVSVLTNQETEFQELNDSKEQTINIDRIALKAQNLVKEFSNSSTEELVQALDSSGLSLSENLVLDVLRRLQSDWKSAFQFFSWVSNNPSGSFLGIKAYNEMLGILGKAKRFNELDQLFDDMFNRGIMNERSYGIVVHRYAAAHKIDDAIDFFYKRKQYELKVDLIAFQTLLMSLCRYKHVEAAEFLFHSKKGHERSNSLLGCNWALKKPHIILMDFINRNSNFRKIEVDESLKQTFQNMHQGYPTETLTQFLRAREWNVDKAHKMLVDALNWRVQNEIDNILTEIIAVLVRFQSVSPSI